MIRQLYEIGRNKRFQPKRYKTLTSQMPDTNYSELAIYRSVRMKTKSGALQKSLKYIKKTDF